MTCCGPKPCCSEGIEMPAESTEQSVKQYYGKTLTGTADLKTSACTSAQRPAQLIIDALEKVPDEVKNRYYGCGNVIPLGIDRCAVLDLGCGSGRDCYVAAQLVGSSGMVVGVDITEEQLEVARRNIKPFADSIGWQPSLHFYQVPIESLFSGIANDAQTPMLRPETFDIVISNCVVNLSSNKSKTLQNVYDALKTGGELYFSDVYCDRLLPDDIRNDPLLLGECLGGALRWEDFKQLTAKLGFAEPLILTSNPIDLQPGIETSVQGAKFISITCRLFKVQHSVERCCDETMVAEYTVQMKGADTEYTLHQGLTLPFQKAVPVSTLEATVLRSSWLARYFKVSAESKCC